MISGGLRAVQVGEGRVRYTRTLLDDQECAPGTQESELRFRELLRQLALVPAEVLMCGLLHPQRLRVEHQLGYWTVVLEAEAGR